MGIVDDCLQFLIEGSNLTTAQIHELLTKINTNVNNEGISTRLINPLIDFLCDTSFISVSTKIYFIREALLPNDRIPRDTVHRIIGRLGIRSLSTPFRKETPRAIQSELCRWLVHVYIYMEDVAVYEETFSIWFQLWQLDFLQKWITYLLFWSATTSLVKPWRIKFLALVGNKGGYSNAKTSAALLLERFSTLVPNRAISAEILGLKCNVRRLSTLRRGAWDEAFLANWSCVLDILNRLQRSAFYDLIEELKSLLSFGEPKKEGSTMTTRRNNAVSLNDVDTLEKLAQSFELISIPKDIEAVVTSRNRCSFVFLATVDAGIEFWKRVSQWCVLQQGLYTLGGEFPFIDKLTMGGLLSAYTLNRDKDSQSFCSVKEPPTEIEIICNLASPVLSDITCKRITFARNKVRDLGNCRFYSMCRSVLAKLYILSKGAPGIMESPLLFEALNHIKSFITEDMRERPSDRHVTATLRLVVRILSNFSSVKLREDFAASVLLSKETVNISILSTDPLAIGVMSEYLILSKNIIQACSKNQEVIELHNAHVLDLTNYMWRNKVAGGGTIFEIPLVFVRRMMQNLTFGDSGPESKSWFTVVNIPALSFSSRCAVNKLENALSSKSHFSNVLTEKSFNDFKRKVGDISWLDTISSFYELKVAILGMMRHQEMYKNNSRFLYAYLRSLADFEKS
ncbi:LANO_0H18426g1_1 [Lachancea nothofagi CBS 11611]|uniref:LANO_0H18426g1_1 n=1 Tax=Lachancea nothofagi CBS 11611 TaxID=1266666 RepID=A0A1G4KN15_9SACH|nr:LANO_0H18426g1_1 [Lachancea nothofagi CBS 11611]